MQQQVRSLKQKGEKTSLKTSEADESIFYLSGNGPTRDILKTLKVLNGKYQKNKMRGIYLPRYGADELLLILTYF